MTADNVIMSFSFGMTYNVMTVFNQPVFSLIDCMPLVSIVRKYYRFFKAFTDNLNPGGKGIRRSNVLDNKNVKVCKFSMIMHIYCRVFVRSALAGIIFNFAIRFGWRRLWRYKLAWIGPQDEA